MPIESGAKGRVRILGAPGITSQPRGDRVGRYGGFNGGGPGGSGVGLSGLHYVPFRSPPLSMQAYAITGVTRDSTGAPLGGVTVDLFTTADDVKVATTVSDGAGNFQFPATAGPYYLVAYKPGAPDVAGTSTNTLTGV